jgi:hypothetical protein
MNELSLAGTGGASMSRRCPVTLKNSPSMPIEILFYATFNPKKGRISIKNVQRIKCLI